MLKIRGISNAENLLACVNRFGHCLTVCVTGGWGRKRLENGKLLKLRNKPQKRAESQPSGARFVGWQFEIRTRLILQTGHCHRRSITQRITNHHVGAGYRTDHPAPKSRPTSLTHLPVLRFQKQILHLLPATRRAPLRYRPLPIR